MPFYQDPKGGLHFLSSADIAAGGLALLPTGAVAITDDQAANAQAQSRAAAQADQPIVVDMWRAKAVLRQTAFTPSTAQASVQAAVSGATNLLDAASILVNASGNPTLEAFWEYAPAIRSDDANLLAVAAQLNIASATIKSLFQQALNLTV